MNNIIAEFQSIPSKQSTKETWITRLTTDQRSTLDTLVDLLNADKLRDLHGNRKSRNELREWLNMKFDLNITKTALNDYVRNRRLSQQRLQDNTASESKA